MIQIENLTKSFWTPEGRKYVLRNANATFPTGVSVGLLGRNGAGKSTLMGMIGGTVRPDSGNISTTGTVSWPVGFSGSFHRDMTGAQNTRFIARIYGIDSESLLAFVADFAELGPHFYLPVRHYSAGMRSRLAFGVSIGIPFDTYLVDEVTAVGDANFKIKSRIVFQERMKQAWAVVVSHSMIQLAKLCQAGAVLENGALNYFPNIHDAIARHQENMGSREEN
ncbi:MAG: ABC transporter ATP-binding protein [Amylibacter sp.]|nr:ABC transporter ATP-binding protein [Amylibacter sp.]